MTLLMIQPSRPTLSYTAPQQIIIASSEYTLTASDAGKVLILNAAGTVLVPANIFDSSTAPVILLNMSDGEITVAATNGLVISQIGSVTTITQYFFAKLRFLSGTTAILSRVIQPEAPPPGPFTNVYDGALYVFSTRQTRSGQTEILQVQRSSDNTDQWFGPDSNGDLDTAAILSFCGSGDGRVIGWREPVTGGTAVPTNTTGLLLVDSGLLITNAAGNPAVRCESVFGNDRALRMIISPAALTFRSEFSTLMSFVAPSSYTDVNERPICVGNGSGSGGSIIGLRCDDRSLRFNNGFEVFSGGGLTGARNIVWYSPGTSPYSASRFFEATESASSSSNGGPGSTNNITEIVLGGYRNNSGSIESLRDADIDLSEIAIYPGYLSDADRNTHRTTLAAYNGGS